MPIFQYEALNASGHEIEGEIDALCDREAVSKIRGKGLIPTRVRTKRPAKKLMVKAPAASGIRRRSAAGRVKLKRITQFARQMATLQDAGLAILRSLRILEKQQKKGTFKRVIGYVADDIEGGATLSEAMGRYPRCFNRLFVSMVAAGEVGGVLDVILVRVAEFLEKSQQLKSRIKGAMVYPVVVLMAAFLIVMGLMTFVVPVFANVLTDMAAGDFHMPALTQVLMDASVWLRSRYGMNALMVAASPFLIVVTLRLGCQFRPVRYGLDWLKLHVPLVGGLVYRTAMARWTRTLATLIAAGVPILDALKITRCTTENEIYAALLDRSYAAIRRGDMLAAPIRRSGAVDELAANMIEVGEETGDLDKMLLKIADNFDEEADVLISSLMSVLEPVMIIGLGAVVAAIVLAIFLPVLEILKNLL